MKYVLVVAKVLLSLAFAGAGITKLIGLAEQIAVFETLGLGQWFRYAAGIIEVAAVVLLWLPGKQAIGAGLLVCTMVGALIAHVAILGPPLFPAVVLGLLAAFVLFQHRTQITSSKNESAGS